MLKEIDTLYAKSTLLHSEQEIHAAIDKMAESINQSLANEDPLFLCVMNGGVILMGHLMTRLNFHLQMDYVHATRYKDGMQGGEIEWIHKPRIDVQGRVVVIVDDILDAGLTLAAIRDELMAMGAKDVLVAVLINKLRERPPEGVQKPNYVGLQIEDHFIFGFGLDYKGYLRNLAGIFQVHT